MIQQNLMTNLVFALVTGSCTMMGGSSGEEAALKFVH